MQTLSSHEELKRDPLQDSVRSGLEWIAAHRQTFFSIVGTLAVLIVVAAFIVSNFRNLRQQAWERYSAGQNWAYSGNADNAINQFNEVINQFSRTPAAAYAVLSKGDILYQQRKFPEAVEAYKQCIDRDPPKVILPFAMSALGNAQEDQGDFQGAIASYKDFLSRFPDHLLAPKVHEALGRTYELALNPDAAKETYEKIITLYPSTLWAEHARKRYQVLNPQPFQSNVPNITPSGAGK